MEYKAYNNDIFKKNNEIAYFKYNPNLVINNYNSKNTCFINALYFSSVIQPINLNSSRKKREQYIKVINQVSSLKNQIQQENIKRMRLQSQIKSSGRTITKSKMKSKQQLQQINIKINKKREKIKELKKKEKNLRTNEGHEGNEAQNYCNQNYNHYFKEVSIDHLIDLIMKMPTNTTVILKYAKLNSIENHAFVIYKNINNEIKIMKDFSTLNTTLFSINEQCATYQMNQLNYYFKTIKNKNFNLYLWIKRKII